MSDLSFIQKVAAIQQKLKAPKNQRNKFGNYNYRNQEDILEAVKPLLGDLVLTVNDEIAGFGDRVYVKATATITDGVNRLSNSAFAREASEQKGMADAQLTGATSSYARKYALNGLFLIDDTKDADADEYQGNKKPEAAPAKEQAKASSGEAPQGLVKTDTKPMTVQSGEVKAAETPPKKTGGWGSKKNTPKKDGDLY